MTRASGRDEPRRSAPTAPSARNPAAGRDRPASPKTPKPASDAPSARPTTSLTDEVLWERLVELASERTVDSVFIDQLELVEQRADLVRVRQVDGTTTGQAWIAERMPRLVELLAEVSGGTRPVELQEPLRPAAKPASSEPDPKFRTNPVVREAMARFDATIHSIRELPVSTQKPSGETEDV